MSKISTGVISIPEKKEVFYAFNFGNKLIGVSRDYDIIHALTTLMKGPHHILSGLPKEKYEKINNELFPTMDAMLQKLKEEGIDINTLEI